MFIPGVPLFDVGDRDVLFVRGNGGQMVPLVGWQEGRFRIVNDMVYSDAGKEAWLTKTGQLVWGGTRLLEEAITHRMGSTPLRFEQRQPVPDGRPPAGAQRMDTAGLANFIRAKMRPLGSQRSAIQKVQPTLNIQDQFYVEPVSALP